VTVLLIISSQFFSLDIFTLLFLFRLNSINSSSFGMGPVSVGSFVLLCDDDIAHSRATTQEHMFETMNGHGAAATSNHNNLDSYPACLYFPYRYFLVAQHTLLPSPTNSLLEMIVDVVVF
jgi:hypothetical protein